MMVQQLIIFGVVGIFGIFLAYTIFKNKRRKHKKSRKSDIPQNTEKQDTGGGEEKEEVTASPVLARVYDASLKPIQNIEISGKEAAKIITACGTLGRQWNYYGESVYALQKAINGVYTPVEKYLEKSRDNPPGKVFKAVHQPEIEVSRDMTQKKSFMQQYGHILPYLVAIAFIIFMMVKG
jgi:hypothetical protein